MQIYVYYITYVHTYSIEYLDSKVERYQVK